MESLEDAGYFLGCSFRQRWNAEYQHNQCHELLRLLKAEAHDSKGSGSLTL